MRQFYSEWIWDNNINDFKCSNCSNICDGKHLYKCNNCSSIMTSDNYYYIDWMKN